VTDGIGSRDELSRRCPMLGHNLNFSYCRKPGSDVPCRKIFDCWWEEFDVEGFIRAHYGDDMIGRILAPRPEKTVTLADLIDKARRGGRTEE
jgi:hypothetical protein